jgi:hypothetical protein
MSIPARIATVTAAITTPRRISRPPWLASTSTVTLRCEPFVKPPWRVGVLTLRRVAVAFVNPAEGRWQPSDARVNLAEYM